MDFNIFNNKIIITNSKDELLAIKKSNPFLNFKILTKKELFDNLFFHYDDTAKIYLFRKGMSFNNAGEILNNLFFLKENVSEKIDNLIKIKDELLKEKLLQQEYFYKEYLKKSKILIYNIPYDKELQLVFSSLNIIPQIIQEKKEISSKIYVFNTLEDEMRYLFEKINHLIDRNIPLDRIKIITSDSNYINNLKKYEQFYSFKFNFPSEITLSQTQDFILLKSILSSTILDEALTQIENRLENENDFLKLFRQLIIVKNYIKEEEIESYLLYLSKSITLKTEKYSNGIDILPSLASCTKNDHVFILGFASNNYPKIYKDDDYLSDFEKDSLQISNSFDLQKNSEEELIYLLSKLDNLYFSYSKVYDKTTYFPSTLMRKLHLQEEKYIFEYKFYSKAHLLFFMSKIIDDKYFSSITSEYNTSQYEDEIKYLEYDHSFKGLEDFHIDNLTLSFTSLNTFFECSFKFYLNYILKINTFEDSINIKIGNIVHRLLEYQAKNISFDFDDVLKDFDLKDDERVIIENLKDMIYKCLDNSQKLHQTTILKDLIAEADSFYYQINDFAKLEGKIDLILSNNDYYAIIDYKTSDYKFEPKKIRFGFSLQLILYYLLTKNNPKFANKELVGMYINTTISKNYKKENYDYLLLNGITLLENGFDILQSNETFIKSNRNKYITYSQFDFDYDIETAKKLIETASNDIKNGYFDINPKSLKGSLACTNCNFKDVCYHTYDDIIYLSEDE